MNIVEMRDLRCCDNCKNVKTREGCLKISKESNVCDYWEWDEIRWEKRRIGNLNLFKQK